MEFLGDLIKDEFRTDYLTDWVFKKKVEDVYCKFKDYEGSFEENNKENYVNEGYSNIQKEKKDLQRISESVGESKLITKSEVPPPLIMFSGPIEGNHKEIENVLVRLLNTAKKRLYVWTYTIANGVLWTDVAKNLKKRLGDNFKIITDQMQMTNKNLKKYSNDLLALKIPIKKNNNAR